LKKKNKDLSSQINNLELKIKQLNPQLNNLDLISNKENEVQKSSSSSVRRKPRSFTSTFNQQPSIPQSPNFNVNRN